MAATVTKMPADLAEAHKLIGDELYFLYTKWNYFKLLFCTADETVATLHYAAEFFFEIYREVIRDDMILSLCRLTDPATTNVKGQDKSNLTIKHLAKMIPNSDTSLRQAVDSDLQDIDSKSVDFRHHRNRRIGHRDLDTRKKCSTALLPNLGLNDMDNVLAAFAALLNRIHQFYDQDERCYDEGIYGSGNAQHLIDFIKYEQDLLKYFEEKEFGG
ncbi:MAG TPA: hypothetical protein VMM76_03430 [Pirellulaceae bacterium]|nr:hypothetical protein [Pirellulaceae bacterium]